MLILKFVPVYLLLALSYMLIFFKVKNVLFFMEHDTIKMVIIRYYLLPNSTALKTLINNQWRWPHGVMVKAMDWEIVLNEFELQSWYYVHFQTNTLGKGMNPLSSQLWVK